MAWCFEDEATAATDEVLDRLRQDPADRHRRCPYDSQSVLAAGRRHGLDAYDAYLTLAERLAAPHATLDDRLAAACAAAGVACLN
jgi:hypothetical protein